MKAPYRVAFWFLLTLSLPAMGQRTCRSGMGLKAGPQWTTERAADISFQPIPGGLAGAYVPLWCGARFELQPELLLSYQGADELGLEKDPVRLRMLYMQLPISAKLYLSNAVNLQGGLQVGKLLSAEANGDVITDQFSSCEAGITAGMGVDLISGFDITARYYAGSTPVRVTKNDQYVTNRGMQLTAGYRILRFSHARRRPSKH